MYSRNFSDRAPPSDIPAHYAGTALKREPSKETSNEESRPQGMMEEGIPKSKEKEERKEEEAIDAGFFGTSAKKETPFCAPPPPPPPGRGEGGLFSPFRGFFKDSGIEAEDLLLLGIALLLMSKDQENGLLAPALLFLLLIK